MELRQLEYFYLATKAGSFSAAAKVAYVTQQTLSASIASLESEWGFPLFHRRKQGIELTEFGKTILEHSNTILTDVRNLEARVSHYKEANSTTIGFAYATASLPLSGPEFSLEMLEQFRKSHPEENLRLFELTSDACLSAVEHEAVDLAFVVGEPPTNRFNFEKLADARLLVAIASDHPLSSHDTISFQDLENIELFPVPDLNVSFSKIVAGFARYDLSPRFAAIPFSLENAIEFVRSKAGVDFSPAHNAHRAPEGISYIPLIEEDDFKLPLGLVTRLDLIEKPLAVELKTAIKRTFTQQ